MGGVISWTNGTCEVDDDTETDTETDLELSPTCPTDVNMDGTTNVSDLLMILGEFGIDCE